MPVYSLPSVYLGSDAEAREFLGLVKALSRAFPNRFDSQNDFLKHCILYTMENEAEIRMAVKKLDR